MSVKDNFNLNPDDMPYDDFLKAQKEQLQAAPKGSGKTDPSSDGPANDGAFSIEEYNGDGGYDSYLAHNASKKKASGGANPVSGDGMGGSAGDNASSVIPGMGGKQSGSSAEGNDGINVLAGGNAGKAAEGAGEAASASASEVATNLGSKIMNGMTGMTNALFNGMKNMALRSKGAIGDIARAIHVSTKVVTLAMALAGGGGATLLGVLLFGGGNNKVDGIPSRNDCQVGAVHEFQFVDNSFYNVRSMNEVDSSAKAIYTALSSSKLINEIIGYRYKVGAESDGTAAVGGVTIKYKADPYLNDRQKTTIDPETNPYVDADRKKRYIKLTEDENKVKDPDPNAAPGAVVDTWIYDMHIGNPAPKGNGDNQGDYLWSHGPATLNDIDDGASSVESKTYVNVIPGNGTRLDSEYIEESDVSRRIGAGLLPGLSDQRTQKFYKDRPDAVAGVDPETGDAQFRDEAILGMILNAEQESGVNPACWEMMNKCFLYYRYPSGALEFKGPSDELGVLTGTAGDNTSNLILATTHHRDWNTYVRKLQEVWAAGGTSINLAAYSYADRWDAATEYQNEGGDVSKTHYYPGSGLWQWTGPRAYGMQEWNNMLLNIKDNTLDTANDAMWTMTSQLYYVLFENYGSWSLNAVASADPGASDPSLALGRGQSETGVAPSPVSTSGLAAGKNGKGATPKDHGGQPRTALTVNGVPLANVYTGVDDAYQNPHNDYEKAGDKAANGRVSLIEWGWTDRYNYKETIYANIPNRPGSGTDTLYGRDRTAIHVFDKVHWSDQAANDGAGETYTNHDTLVRPQFDFVYLPTSKSPVTTFSGGVNPTVRDDSSGNLRAIHPRNVIYLYRLMLNAKNRPDPIYNKSCPGNQHDDPDYFCLVDKPDDTLSYSFSSSDTDGETWSGIDVTGEHDYSQHRTVETTYDCDSKCTGGSMCSNMCPSKSNPLVLVKCCHCKKTPNPPPNVCEKHPDKCGCLPEWCFHQCQLDEVRNYRDMIKYLMQTYKDKTGKTWWEGLEEADFLDVDYVNEAENIQCGEILYKNYHTWNDDDAFMLDYLKNDYDLTNYYVKWYYDLSVEVKAVNALGSYIFDTDNMNATFDGSYGAGNGVATRPDNRTYQQGSTESRNGDWIVYESTPENATGFVPGRLWMTDSAGLTGDLKDLSTTTDPIVRDPVQANGDDTNHPYTSVWKYDKSVDGYGGYSNQRHSDVVNNDTFWSKGWIYNGGDTNYGFDDLLLTLDQLKIDKNEGESKETPTPVTSYAKLPGSVANSYVPSTSVNVDQKDQTSRFIYMGRPTGDSERKYRWGSYNEYVSETLIPNGDNLVEAEKILLYTEDNTFDTNYWMGWNADSFNRWYGDDDLNNPSNSSVAEADRAMHAKKLDMTQSSLKKYEYIDWYYRRRLSGKIAPSVWDPKTDGSLYASGMNADGKVIYTGTAGRQYPIQPVEPTIDDLGGAGDLSNAGSATGETGTVTIGEGVGKEYQFVKNLSDNLMLWAESRAYAQTSRINAREYTKVWEGGPTMNFYNDHSKFKMAVHFAYQMLSDSWSVDNEGAKSIFGLWYEDTSAAPMQDWWKSFYRNYCKTDNGVAFEGIAECAVSWAWLQGHESDYTGSKALEDDPGFGNIGKGYKKTMCTPLYVEVKKIVATQAPLLDPMPDLYSSCDRGVATAVQASGADDNFVWGAARHQLEYARAHSDIWEEIGRNTIPYDDMEPGDLILSDHHVIVFVGGKAAAEKWPDYVGEEEGQYGIVHSSLSMTRSNSRGPRYDMNKGRMNDGTYSVFRLIREIDKESSANWLAVDAQKSTLATKYDGKLP